MLVSMFNVDYQTLNALTMKSTKLGSEKKYALTKNFLKVPQIRFSKTHLLSRVTLTTSSCLRTEYRFPIWHQPTCTGLRITPKRVRKVIVFDLAYT
jgi:hypothetical protein